MIRGNVDTTVTTKTRLTITGGELECIIREILEREGTIRPDQEIDFDWDISQSFVRELLVTWEQTT